MNYLLITHFII